MMDEATNLRKIMDHARVCILISAAKELKTIIEVDVGRKVIFKVEYAWV